jgi:hypothetical protein
MLSVLSLLAVLSLVALAAVGVGVVTNSSLTSDDPLRWHKAGAFLGVLVFGWIFIVWSNKFHVTAPVVFVCLGYFAIVTTVLNLWRTGAAVVAPEGSEEEQWGRPLGAKGELEKEKRTLLKAIKEAEFDHAMGKLSKADVDQLVRGYRARAIEVIKALDHLETGAALDTRGKIEREVRARIQLAASDKPSKRAANATAMKAAQADEKAAKAAAAEAKADAKAAKAETKSDEKAAADADAKPAVEEAAKEPEATATSPTT